MIVLDTTYRKEPIPGMRAMITATVRTRTADMLGLNDPPFTRSGRDRILSAFDQWEADRIYAASPFADVLNAYPGPADMTKLYEYQKRLAEHTTNIKEMNEWANNIITIIRNELWPPKSWIN